MPERHAVIATPSTRTPEPCAISQPSAPIRRPPLGAPWAPASVRNQPTTPIARQTTRVAAGSGRRRRGRRAAPAVGGGQVAASTSAAARGRGRGQQRGHGTPIIARGPAPFGGPTPQSASGWAPAPSRTVVRHEGPRRVRRLLQGLARPTAAADLRPDRRPRHRAPPCATRSSSPGTTGARSRGSTTPRRAVRPHAWRHAQRRHTARLWHREKGLDPEVKATLDALGQLPVTSAGRCSLTQLATVSMRRWPARSGSPARTPSASCRPPWPSSRSSATCPTAGIRAAFAPLERADADSRCPRSTIIRRAGAARRRTHTTVGRARGRGGAARQRRPGHRCGRRTTHAGPCGRRHRHRRAEVPPARADRSRTPRC